MQPSLSIAWLVQEGLEAEAADGLRRAERSLAWLTPILVTLAVALVLVGVRKLLDRYGRSDGGNKLRDQLIMFGLALLGLLTVILNLPIDPAERSDLLHLLGVVLSAAIALSSTTLLSNAMGALMLRSMRNFRLGDFIQIGEYLGRVTERGLFHTEIQTEDRDLLTLPNMYVITHPVRVVRSTGTIVSCTLSLGYDVPRKRIEPLLIAAAERSGLTDAFVQVTSLGDFSVTYRIAGLLSEVKHILSFRSGLRKAVMDVLHEDGVEIVSPSFMNTRGYDPRHAFIPRPLAAAEDEDPAEDGSPEDVIFDKAEEAESLDQSRERLVRLDAAIKELKERVAAGGDGAEAAKSRMQRLERRRADVDAEIKEHAAQLKGNGH